MHLVTLSVCLAAALGLAATDGINTVCDYQINPHTIGIPVGLVLFAYKDSVLESCVLKCWSTPGCKYVNFEGNVCQLIHKIQGIQGRLNTILAYSITACKGADQIILPRQPLDLDPSSNLGRFLEKLALKGSLEVTNAQSGEYEDAYKVSLRVVLPNKNLETTKYGRVFRDDINLDNSLSPGLSSLSSSPKRGENSIVFGDSDEDGLRPYEILAYDTCKAEVIYNRQAENAQPFLEQVGIATDTVCVFLCRFIPACRSMLYLAEVRCCSLFDVEILDQLEPANEEGGAVYIGNFVCDETNVTTSAKLPEVNVKNVNRIDTSSKQPTTHQRTFPPSDSEIEGLQSTFAGDVTSKVTPRTGLSPTTPKSIEKTGDGKIQATGITNTTDSAGTGEGIEGNELAVVDVGSMPGKITGVVRSGMRGSETDNNLNEPTTKPGCKCSGEWKKHGNNCYRKGIAGTWDDSNRHCRKLDSRAHLPYFTDKQDWMDFTRMRNGMVMDILPVWLGYQDAQGEGWWNTVSGCVAPKLELWNVTTSMETSDLGGGKRSTVTSGGLDGHSQTTGTLEGQRLMSIPKTCAQSYYSKEDGQEVWDEVYCVWPLNSICQIRCESCTALKEEGANDLSAKPDLDNAKEFLSNATVAVDIDNDANIEGVNDRTLAACRATIFANATLVPIKSSNVIKTFSDVHELQLCYFLCYVFHSCMSLGYYDRTCHLYNTTDRHEGVQLAHQAAAWFVRDLYCAFGEWPASPTSDREQLLPKKTINDVLMRFM